MAPLEDEKVKVALREATFNCRYCDSGSESFSELFGEGSCKKCGGPAGVIIETSRPEDIEAIGKSVIVVASKEDEERAKAIMENLGKEEISVIDPNLVVANEQAGDRANILAFLAEKARYVLVIPGKEGQFASDRLVAAAVEGEFLNGSKKVIPLYPDKSYQGRSLLLDGHLGVVWEGEADHCWGKKRFVDFLKK